MPKYAIILYYYRLPVNFGTEEVTPTFQEYATVLKAQIPEIFDSTFTVLTEFGRAYNAKAILISLTLSIRFSLIYIPQVGIVAAKVEYTKLSGGRGIAVIQGGADLFLRTVSFLKQTHKEYLP